MDQIHAVREGEAEAPELASADSDSRGKSAQNEGMEGMKEAIG